MINFKDGFIAVIYWRTGDKRGYIYRSNKRSFINIKSGVRLSSDVIENQRDFTENNHLFKSYVIYDENDNIVLEYGDTSVFY